MNPLKLINVVQSIAELSNDPSSKTDILVTGESVGKTKTEAAKKNGTTVLTEQDYLELINE